MTQNTAQGAGSLSVDTIVLVHLPNGPDRNTLIDHVVNAAIESEATVMRVSRRSDWAEFDPEMETDHYILAQQFIGDAENASEFLFALSRLGIQDTTKLQVLPPRAD